MDVVKANRFDVYLVNLDPTVGSEIQKTRPCVVVSPDEMNHNLRTVIIAPMTSTIKAYPSRLPLEFNGKKGTIAMDQLRSVDQTRLVKRWGAIEPETADQVCDTLVEMFRR